MVNKGRVNKGRVNKGKKKDGTVRPLPGKPRYG